MERAILLIILFLLFFYSGYFIGRSEERRVGKEC